MIDYRFFDPIQEVVLVIDHEGRVVYANTAASFLFDVSAKRLASGKPLAGFVTFEPNAMDLDLKSLTEPSQMREVIFNAASGKSGSVQIIIQPQPAFFAGSDATFGSRFIVTIRDVSLEKVLQKKYRGELDQKESVIADLKSARSKLEDYSKNLEVMVAERTTEITKTNALLRTILDSLGQGILVFGEDGKTLPIYSQVCRTLFGDDLAGQPIEKVLGFSEGEGDAFANWRQAVFAEMLDFADLTPLAPSRLSLPAPKEIALSYNRMINEQGSTAGVVVVTTDRTAEMEAVRVAQHERALVKKIVQVAKHRDAFRMFVDDAQALISQFLSGQAMELEELERKLHTLKGGAATFALEPLAQSCHHFEDFLKSMGSGGLHSASFKMRLVRTANEMKNLLDGELQTLTDLLGPVSKAKAFLKIDDVLNVYSMSMMELAERLGKKLEPLEIEGGLLEVSTSRFQGLLNSFVHAFKNAIDHGLELPETRIKLGKSAAGRLNVRCQQSSDALTIVIADDGGGVRVDKVREKLLSNPSRKELGESGSDFDVTQAILLGDLSTADVVTDISGRGVGLSAVAEEVHKLGGQIRVDSVSGQGTSITLTVPLQAASESQAA